MDENVEFTESVKITEPVSGRQMVVHLTDNEVHMLCSVGINTLLAAGLLSVIQQEEGDAVVQPTDGTMQ